MLFGEFLLKRKAVTAQQLSEALTVQQKRYPPVSTVAVELHYVLPDQELALQERLHERIREAIVESLIDFGLADDQITNILAEYDRASEPIEMILVELGHLDSTMLVSELSAFKDMTS